MFNYDNLLYQKINKNMDVSYWLLITHTFSLFPITVFLWTYKRRKTPESIYMLIKFIYCVSFSLLYHTYHVEDMTSEFQTMDTWLFLDKYTSSCLIFTTIMYCLRVRPPQFYITISGIETGFLMFIVLENIHTVHLMTWMIILSTIVVSVLKWRTLYRYVQMFYYNSFLVVLFSILSTVYFFLAMESKYTFHHSLWHCFVFISAGLGGMLKYKLDEIVHPISRRETLESI
jgi:hypothetical protein